MGDRDTEHWLRLHGLPYFVRPDARAGRLLARTAPFLVFAVSWDVISTFVLRVSIDTETAAPDQVLLAFAAVLLVIAFPVVPVALGVLTARLLRSRRRIELPVALAALVLFLVADPLYFQARALADALPHAARNLLVVIAALVLTWLGVGALLSWAVRAAFRQLGALAQLATRALPILMLVVVFAFFARELWEVTSGMSVKRLVAVALFFAVLGLLFAIPIMRSEMAELEQSGPALSGLERFNLAVVLVLAQAFQVVIFAALACLFLLVLGQFAFSRPVLDSWLGADSPNVTAFGVELPLRVAMLKTAVFLSCVSSLNFLVSVAAAAPYKSAFYHPLLREARAALTVRAAYRAGR
jgi:hypothetical protein